MVIVESDHQDLNALAHQLSKLELTDAPLSLRSCAEARAHLVAHPADVVLVTLGLPDSTGLDTLAAIRAAAPDKRGGGPD